MPKNSTMAMALQFKKGEPDNHTIMHLQAIPCGSHTDTLTYYVIAELPREFEFHVYIKFKQGRTTLKKKYP